MNSDRLKTILFFVRGCFVCGTRKSVKQHRSKDEQRYLVFLNKGIFIAPGARCCEEHLCNKQLTYEALQAIQGSISSIETWNAKEISQYFSGLRLAMNSLKIFDFDIPCYMNDNDFMVMTSLSKGNKIVLFFPKFY